MFDREVDEIRRKRTVYYIVIAIVILLFFVYIGKTQYHKMVLDSQIKSWSSNWGFEAPLPEKVTTVFNTGGRDGDYYLISDYGEVAIKKLIQQNEWNVNHDGIISSQINGYKKTIQNSYQEYERYEKLFKENPVKINSDTLYFTKRKTDGSYIVAVLNKDEKRLFTMEVFF